MLRNKTLLICIVSSLFLITASTNALSKKASKPDRVAAAKTVLAFTRSIETKDIKTFVAMWHPRERKDGKKLTMLLKRFHKPLTKLAAGMKKALKKKKPFQFVFDKFYKRPAANLKYQGINRSGEVRTVELKLLWEKGKWMVADLD